jgi:hypothetical protein
MALQGLGPAARVIANERREMLHSGLACVPKVYQEQIAAYEPLLRIRWDFWGGHYVVDRWIKENNAWMIVMKWIFPDETPRRLGPFSVAEMIDFLNQGDTHRFRNAKDYIEFKRVKAEKIREARDKESTEQVLEAVDRMSSKSIEQFINVERALHTGEKIIAHGSDEKFLDRVHAKTKEALAKGEPLDHPAAADNPGMNPLKYKRKYNRKRKEIHETRIAR